ncbi:MAG TPA: BadF/BadG/BcrA/BcrD ATPase family protein, partial [Roseiflexaceae bacterium]|nr:BadF/BadG/BcrA/BcrD ATPase family protein [Roseiflexaceae bacterium]
SNKQVSGVAATLATLDQVIEAVFAAAGRDVTQVASACLGLSGVDRDEDLALIRAWADERRLSNVLTVVNDARLVIAAGTPAGFGVGLICGTGSIAVGRAPDGRMGRAGGWGYLLGDEGSGYDIALRALRAACSAADGRAVPTLLLDTILQRWQLSQPSDLIPHVYHRAEARGLLAELPPLVSACAEQGDAVSIAILRGAGRDLAAAVAAVARELQIAPPLPVAIAGSVIQRTPLLQQALQHELAALGWPADPIHAVEEPAIGAVRLAREALESHNPTERCSRAAV